MTVIRLLKYSRMKQELSLSILFCKQVLGIRMCPHCPHCTKPPPCQDALGSVAEFMPSIAGRPDAMSGAVECQKSTGSLHYHVFLFVQRLHQFASLKEIVELLTCKVVLAAELKDFLANICCECLEI